MVNLGGKRTMLGQWRIVLRQAEESARAGRFDEALALIARPDVTDHRQAVHLRGRLAQELVERATRRAKADDMTGALSDLDAAERYGVAPDKLATARLEVAERAVDEVRSEFEAGEPARVVQRVDKLAHHKVSGPALRRLRDAADAWQKAIDELRRGEFGVASEGFDRAERLASGAGSSALAAARRDLETRHKAAHPKVERLYSALASGQSQGAWSEILAAAESVLEVLPEHPAAKQARQRAWQQISAINPSATLPGRSPSPPLGHAAGAKGLETQGIVFLDQTERPEPPARDARKFQLRVASPRGAEFAGEGGANGAGAGHRVLLWADTIGGFLVCMSDRIVIGRAGPDGVADVQVLGDLSRSHATLIRDGDGYVVRAHHPTFINGRQIEQAPLRDGDVIRLGSSVELEFRQPSPVSATARLGILSRHRLPLAVDSVILMAETCIVGPSKQSHILAPDLDAPVVLYRQGKALWCRAPGEFDVDGRNCASRAPLTNKSHVKGRNFSFSLEPVPGKSVDA